MEEDKIFYPEGPAYEVPEEDKIFYPEGPAYEPPKDDKLFFPDDLDDDSQSMEYDDFYGYDEMENSGRSR